MRPKLLEIEGLQSFCDVQRIDFELLGGAGLFGIFGPTGSGKSTILDAVTFALYGKVKRADGGTQGIINTNMNIAKVSFTFEIGKDASRKTFRVERTYQRKKGTQNSCEPKIARLIEITGSTEIPVCDRATDVSSNVKELLGLSNEDFTRAVVLPQNSFQEFLLLSNSDRRKMLERIFYLEEYGKKLQEKLNRKMSIQKSRIDVLSGELKGYSDATDEALIIAKNEMNAAISELSRIEKELKLLKDKYDEEKEIFTLIQELRLIEQKEQLHLISEKTVLEKKEQLDKAQKANEMSEMIRKSKELKEKHHDTERQLQEVVVTLPAVTENLKVFRQNYEEIKSKAAAEQPDLVAKRTRFEDALNSQSEIQADQNKISEMTENLNRITLAIAEKSKNIENKTEELNNHEKSLVCLKQEAESLKIDPQYRQQIHLGARLENEVEALDNTIKELKKNALSMYDEVDDLNKKLEHVQEDISITEKKLEDLNTAKLDHEDKRPEDRSVVSKHIDDFHIKWNVYEVLLHKKEELDNIELEITTKRTKLEELTQKALLLEKDRLNACEIFNQCKEERENALREKGNNTVQMLSKNLKAGEPCPVCGSEYHPNPFAHEEVTELTIVEKRIEDAEKSLADTEKKFEEAKKTALVADEQVKALTSQIEQHAEKIKDKTYEYSEHKQKLPEDLRNFEISQIRQRLDKIKEGNTEKLRLVEVWEKKLEQYKEEIQKLAKIKSEHLLSENGLCTQLTMNKESLKKINKSLEGNMNLFDKTQQNYLEFIKQNGIESVAAELANLAEKDRKANATQKQMEKVQNFIAEKRDIIEKCKEELRITNNESIKAEAEVKNLIGQKAQKESKLYELVGNANIKEEIKYIDEKLAEYIRFEKEYHENLQHLEKQHNELKIQESLLASELKIYSESLQDEEKSLQTALLGKGFRDLDEAEHSVLPYEKQKVLRDEINEYDQSGARIRAEKEMVGKKLNSRSVTEEEWNRTSKTYDNLISTKDECFSRSEVAKNNFENIKNKHDQWIKLNTSYQELEHKQGLFEQIQKLLRANSFIDYVAEERLRYVARKASETLGVMTKGKYALELDAEAGFIVRDYANGGVHRMVNSLSGGETFLTSLSLALALSDHIQLKGQSPLEFFFLDEGFGTLDSTLLDTVIDSLERLSGKERVIGLISHVPELRSRIARRLIVDPPASQGKGSRVKIEMA